MKQFIQSFSLILIPVSATFARQAPPPEKPKHDQSMVARVTVYWASGGRGSDRYTRQHKCATGTRLRTGHCAVDPKHIPFGSRVVLPDGTSLAAVDTGTAVKNRKAARKSGRTVSERNALVIDRFFETKKQALSWAKRNPLFMPVRVVPPIYRPAQETQDQMIVAKATPVSTSPVAANSPNSNSASVTNSQSAANLPALAYDRPMARNPLNRLGR